MNDPKENKNDGKNQDKGFTIIVNARRKVVPTNVVSFEQIVSLAFEPVPPNALFTVTYRGAEGHKEGTLQPGQTVTIKEGTIFNVTETGQS